MFEVSDRERAVQRSVAAAQEWRELGVTRRLVLRLVAPHWVAEAKGATAAVERLAAVDAARAAAGRFG